MGGALSQLVCIFLRSGCSGSDTASSLAFHPPRPAFYSITYDDKNDKYNIILASNIPYQVDRGLKVEFLKTKTNTYIPVIYIKYSESSKTILYSHGNATDIGAMYSLYHAMAYALKVNIIAYDYTGYGSSNISDPNKDIESMRKKCTEKQIYKDIDRVYEWCIDNKIVINPEINLFLYGQSVGSGPTCYLASKKVVAGIIIHSGILSGLRVITTSRLFCACDIFPNIDRIANVKCPVFIIHGLEDLEVPVNHGKTLYDTVPDKFKYQPWYVPNRGHNNVIIGNEREYFRRLTDFLQNAHTTITTTEKQYNFEVIVEET